MSCPSDQQFIDLVENGLDGSARSALFEHVGGCAPCCRLLAALARGELGEASRRVAHYDLERQIGRGGMGVVFRAVDTRSQRLVALKLLAPHLADDDHATARLLREARAAGALDHPNVAQVYEVGQAGGAVYIALAFYEGETLRERLKRGPLAPREAAAILREMALGLGCAHAAGIVHRDVKPSNVLLTSSGARLLDFGLAKLDAVSEELTASGQLLGTVAYMAPEQQTGHATPRADVWSLGVTGYEMLTGASPFTDRSATEMLRAARHVEPAPPRAPAALQAVIMKCLEKDPMRRYATADEVARDLERWLSGEPVLARGPSPVARARRTLRRHRAIAAGLVALAIAAVGATALVRSRRDARARLERAERLAQAAQRIRSRVRDAYLLPLHDTSAERVEVRAELRAIEEELTRLGPDDRGLAHYALGVGALALRDFAGARPHLEAAWRAGQTGPEAAYALALTLANGYHLARGDVERTPPAERPAAEKKLFAELRDPALAYVRASAGTAPPGAVEALVAYFEARDDDALRLTRGVFERTPSEYELGELYARALLFQLVGKWRAGDAKALDRLGEVEDAYARVIAVARSDPGMYLNFAQGLIRVATYKIFSGAPGVEEALGRALERIAQAEASAPDDATLLAVHSDILVARGMYARSQGHDGRPVLKEAVAVADRGCRAAPNQWQLLFARGKAEAQLGETQTRRNEDARPALERAAADLKASLALHDSEDAWHQLAYAAWTLAEFRAARGDGRARENYADAARTLEETVRIEPNAPTVYSDLGMFQVDHARFELSEGRDPRAILDAAERALDEAARLGPGDASPLESQSAALIVRARYALATGGDAGLLLERAVKLAERSVQVTDDNGSEYALGEALLARARAAERAERDGAADLVRARAALEKALAASKDDTPTQLAVARAELFAAERDRAHGSTARARVLLDRLTAGGEARGAAFALDVEAHRLGARAGRTAECAAGDAAAARALALNPRDARALYERARLDEACAPLAGAARLDAAQKSRAAALAIDPLIEKDPG